MSCDSLVVDGTAHIVGEFRTPQKVLADPTDVDFYWITPTDYASTSISGHYAYPADPELVRDSTGMYHVDLPSSEEGRWYYKWDVSGAVTGTFEGTFAVGESEFAGRST